MNNSLQDNIVDSEIKYEKTNNVSAYYRIMNNVSKQASVFEVDSNKHNTCMGEFY